MKNQPLMVYVSCPPRAARRLAQALVKQRVAACVNIVPAVNSVYRWKNKIQQDHESLLVIKTHAGRFAALKSVVLKRHPYELPEIVAVKIADGHRPYLAWINRSCA